MSLEKQVIAITGATGGLGSNAANALAARAASLALLDMAPERLDALAADLSLPDSRILTRTVDLLDPAEAGAAAEAVVAKFGRVDALLHFVGGWTGGQTLLEVPPADLESMLKQHVWTSFHAVRAFVPHMVKGGRGRVVMITSPYAARPSAKGGPYAIAKAGQETLMLTLSQELRGTGVTANLLQAKTIDARRQKVSAPSAENASWSTPEELTSAILFLLSDEAAAVNGAKIPMYGSY